MHGRKGFTFIEITVVIFIVCIMAAISIPRMKGTFVDVRLKGAARDVTALLRYARNVAVLRELPCQVQFDVEKDTYELVLLNASGDEVQEKRSRRRSGKDNNKLSIGDDVAGERNLPKDVHFAMIYTSAPLNADSKLPCVTYYPDGSATPATIAIQDEKAHAISVEIFQTTGMARVQKGLPPEDEGKPKNRYYYGPKKTTEAESS